MNVQNPAVERDYIPIADHGLIGNLRTAALVSLGSSQRVLILITLLLAVESYCIPNFDSPSVFARILDKYKGGHFSITPTVPFTTKQNYLPNSNILQTKFLNDDGVVSVTDFLPRQANGDKSEPPLFWLIRRVEVVRGTAALRMECAPAFNYARDSHTTEFVPDNSVGYCHQKKVLFKSRDFDLDLRYVSDTALDNVPTPEVNIDYLDLSKQGHLGPAVACNLNLEEGQRVTFVLRICPDNLTLPESRPTQELADRLGIPLECASKIRPRDDPLLTKELLEHLFISTNEYWNNWIRKSTYQGSWKEAVHRSALALKLLIYEPTGAVVASPTFSLPEYIGGTRNWDYRASWIRDSSFTLYALIRLGFTQEANAYMDFIFDRLRNKNPDGSLQIMYTIHGGKDLAEIELDHLDGHKGSKPVRIGNGAADHVQLVSVVLLTPTWSEPMRRTFMANCKHLVTITAFCSIKLIIGWIVSTWDRKYVSVLMIHELSPTNVLTSQSHSLQGYDTWVLVRELVDYVVEHCHEPDLSIWEVRGEKRHFTARDVFSSLVIWLSLLPLQYSKIMLWVAIDRGLRLADKRSLPCPNRHTWLAARDNLYEEIMKKAWNPTLKIFGQSYESTDVLDSSVLIMPLVFFMTPSDPRFLGTLKQTLKSPERGGLASNVGPRVDREGADVDDNNDVPSRIWSIDMTLPRQMTGWGGKKGHFVFVLFGQLFVVHFLSD
ncbi:hypothetical protein ID866_4848 [Astraeus odoratus]|nr:hypothetical protein ID866_4848 [Astraeus odoratus]